LRIGSANPVVIMFEDGIAVITVDNPPVTALSAPVREGLLQAIQRAGGEEVSRPRC
jgi:3-hydroxyacyl-CoA dehydrogenase